MYISKYLDEIVGTSRFCSCQKHLRSDSEPKNLRLSQATPSLHSCHCDARSSGRSAGCSPPPAALRWPRTAAPSPDTARDPGSRSLRSQAPGRTTGCDLHRDPAQDRFLEAEVVVSEKTKNQMRCVHVPGILICIIMCIYIYIYIYHIYI